MQQRNDGKDDDDEHKEQFPKDNYDRLNFYVKEMREPKWKEVARSSNQ